MAIPPFSSPPTSPATATRQGKIKLAGDLAGTADAPTLIPVGTAGTYGDATHIPVVTTDAEGRVTDVALVAATAQVQRTFAYFMGG